MTLKYFCPILTDLLLKGAFCHENVTEYFYSAFLQGKKRLSFTVIAMNFLKFGYFSLGIRQRFGSQV